jgi:hypothetical protein
VTARQICDLPAWARSLSEQGPHADAAERAAFLQAKIELLGGVTEDDHRSIGGGG